MSRMSRPLRSVAAQDSACVEGTAVEGCWRHAGPQLSRIYCHQPSVTVSSASLESFTLPIVSLNV